MQPIKLTDGTELVPLEAEEKEKLEAELKEVLDKYDAMYLPVINKTETITNISHQASLFLLKKLTPSPFNGEDIKTEESEND